MVSMSKPVPTSGAAGASDWVTAGHTGVADQAAHVAHEGSPREAVAAEHEVLVGVISDTHSHLYPEVTEALAGVDHIIHAGDICQPEVLARLKAIAPVTAVRGNCDTGTWASDLPLQADVVLGGVRFLVGHVGGRLRDEAGRRQDGNRPDVVIFGHSHQCLFEYEDGILYLNPGSAGPRRYGRPRTLALVRIRVTESGAPDFEGALARVNAEIVVIDG